MNQPYGSFAKALFEKQAYPDLKDENGNPIPPYDVTAHTLSLLMDVEVKPIYTTLPKPSKYKIEFPIGHRRKVLNNFAIYKAYIPSMDEGWTRQVFEKIQLDYFSLTNKEILSGNLTYKKNLKSIERKLKKSLLQLLSSPTKPPIKCLTDTPKAQCPMNTRAESAQMA